MRRWLSTPVHLITALASHPKTFQYSSTQQNGPYVTPTSCTFHPSANYPNPASSASDDPVIHFVLFVPSTAGRPLHILDTQGLNPLPITLMLLTSFQGSISESNAFLLPQWGGIVILNPQESTPQSTLSSSSLDPAFSAFSNHLLALLGVPNLPHGVKRILGSSHILTDWQLDALVRYRTLSNAKGARDTLQSIVKLVDQIGNMPVGQDVKGDVQGALAALEQVCLEHLLRLTR